MEIRFPMILVPKAMILGDCLPLAASSQKLVAKNYIN